MKFPLLITGSLFFNLASAQYYYNDIIGSNETSRLMQAYVGNKVKMVTSTGFDKNGVQSTEFAEAQEVKESSRTLRSTTIFEFNRTVTLTRFDVQWRIMSITDSAAHSTITYTYDAAGRISKISNVVDDPESDFNTTEIHIWTYNASGKPEKMWRISNGTDSLEIRFVADENGNPGEEISYRKGYETDHVYYYYDEKNRLTDIVRYNKKIKKLMPDVILSYDDDGLVIQKVSSTPGENFGRVVWVGYTTWKYFYDEKGLKTKEVLIDTEQKLAGRIEYSYYFR